MRKTMTVVECKIWLLCLGILLYLIQTLKTYYSSCLLLLMFRGVGGIAMQNRTQFTAVSLRSWLQALLLQSYYIYTTVKKSSFPIIYISHYMFFSKEPEFLRIFKAILNKSFPEFLKFFQCLSLVICCFVIHLKSTPCTSLLQSLLIC